MLFQLPTIPNEAARTLSNTSLGCWRQLQIRRTKSYLDQRMTMRSCLGAGEESVRRMPDPDGLISTRKGKLWVCSGEAGRLAQKESPKGAKYPVMPGERQKKTWPRTLTPVVLLQTQGRGRWELWELITYSQPKPPYCEIGMNKFQLTRVGRQQE